MRLPVFSSKPCDVTFLTAANQGPGHGLHFLEPRLVKETSALATLRAVTEFEQGRVSTDAVRA